MVKPIKLYTSVSAVNSDCKGQLEEVNTEARGPQGSNVDDWFKKILEQNKTKSLKKDKHALV